MGMIINPFIGVSTPFTLSDFFTGIFPNSSAVGNSVWDARYPVSSTAGTGSQAIVGNEYVIEYTGPVTDTTQHHTIAEYNGGHAGDIELIVDCTNFDGSTSSGSNHLANQQLPILIGASLYTIQRVQDKNAGTDFFQAYHNGSTTNFNSTATDFGLRITRVSGIIRLYYDVGAGWVQLGATSNNSGTITQIQLKATSRNNQGTSHFGFNSFEAFDGIAGDDIIIPWP